MRWKKRLDQFAKSIWNKDREMAAGKKSYSIRSRLLLFYAMATVALLLVTLVVRDQLEKPVLQVNESRYTSLLVQTADTIDSHLEDYRRMSHVFSENPMLRFYMRQIRNTPDIHGLSAQWGIKKQVLRSANKQMFRNIYVYIQGIDPINCYYETAAEQTGPQMEGLMEEFAQGLRPPETFCAVTDIEPYQLSIINPVYDKGRFLGMMRLDLDMDFFEKIIGEAEQDPDSKLLILDESNTILFSLNKEEIFTIQQDIDLLGEAVHLEMPAYGWRFVGTLPRAKIQEAMNRFVTTFVVMILLIMATMAVYSLLAFRSMLIPMERITASMKRVEEGKLDTELSASRVQEYNVIIGSFNSMVEKVRELLETVYYQQVYLRRAQIGELQSKFNPHFLYNTLDMIYWQLVDREDDETAEMVVALSEILRYSITANHEFTPLLEERRQIQNYLLLQGKRLGDSFEWEIQFEDNILDCKVPCLLLQPLVENAINHAFADDRAYKYVGITGHRQEDRLVLTVIDNGVGMSREAIERVLDEEAPAAGSKLGINLVHKRLQYIYGAQYGIQIQSEPGKGCTIRVMLEASEDAGKYMAPGVSERVPVPHPEEE